MGWNDWAHYQCGFTADTILANARGLVSTGLAARGYKTVTIDDCWMQKDRDASGNLQPDPKRFPAGINPVADTIHAMGLKFGIYEDAGYATCGGFAGSGKTRTGGPDRFLQDTKLFASWGVDYLKLDGCNLYIAPGKSKVSAYREAYAAESKAIKAVRRPIVFSESAPAYFQGHPEWYGVLSWVGRYGQLWREGTDIANFHAKDPGVSRFQSVLWNYAYNLPLGRFQRPGNWNDPDFVIGGDGGMTAIETRSQMALWAMMSAPLILSSDIQALSSQALAILGNPSVIAVDQDSLGRMANLLRRTPTIDVLMKPLANGNYAVAILNRSSETQAVEFTPADLGFPRSGCRFDVRDLWTNAEQQSLSVLRAAIAPHDTSIWMLRTSNCGNLLRSGAIVITSGAEMGHFEGYSHCLGAARAESCSGDGDEMWTALPDRRLRSAKGCLSATGLNASLQPCSKAKAQRWTYTLRGNLINAADQRCLTANAQGELSLKPCDERRTDQIWSLPN
jgi:alpha-galactosidase